MARSPPASKLATVHGVDRFKTHAEDFFATPPLGEKLASTAGEDRSRDGHRLRRPARLAQRYAQFGRSSPASWSDFFATAFPAPSPSRPHGCMAPSAGADGVGSLQQCGNVVDRLFPAHVDRPALALAEGSAGWALAYSGHCVGFRLRASLVRGAQHCAFGRPVVRQGGAERSCCSVGMIGGAAAPSSLVPQLLIHGYYDGAYASARLRPPNDASPTRPVASSSNAGGSGIGCTSAVETTSS